MCPKTLTNRAILRLAGLALPLAACVGQQAAPSPSNTLPLTASATGRATIDDFQTGPDAMTLSTTGLVQKAQAGTMLGGNRCVALTVTGNTYARPASVELRADPQGYLAVDTGVGVDHSLMLLYGYDDQCNARPLDEDLSDFAAFEIRLAALDLDVAGAIAVWTPTGTASAPLDIQAGSTVKTINFDTFTGTPDWAHVQHLIFEVQSGGAVAAHDYLLRSISAVTMPPTP